MDYEEWNTTDVALVAGRADRALLGASGGRLFLRRMVKFAGVVGGDLLRRPNLP